MPQVGDWGKRWGNSPERPKERSSSGGIGEDTLFLGRERGEAGGGRGELGVEERQKEGREREVTGNNLRRENGEGALPTKELQGSKEWESM